MIKVNISEEMIQNCINRIDTDHWNKNKRSFLEGKGKFRGYLGEEIVKKAFPQFIHVDKIEYDFEYKGKKIEVKTKRQTVPLDPKSDWECSVADYTLEKNIQNPDIYILCRIYFANDGRIPFGWILGTISGEEYKEESFLKNKGDYDPSNNFFVKKRCYNMYHKNLTNWNPKITKYIK